MSESDRRRDQTFRKTIEKFLHKMIADHGFSHEEALIFVNGELQREYERKK